MKYRSDIDGLRSVAVLSVVAYHYFPPILPGGFVGVDIFFVISGYLISTIIFTEIDHEDFSILEFYRRRINRIFPALGCVLIASLAIGWFTLFSDEYKSLAKNTLASTAFVENFFLWLQSGYFDSDSIKKPLLHIWSLGVEEQFYIIYPLVLVLAHKLRLLNGTFLTICCFGSFLLSLCVLHYSESADFYFPFTRYWELSIGGVLAWRERAIADGRLPLQQFGLVRPSMLSLTGMLVILASFFLIDARVPFPGVAALLPVIGAGLVICGDTQGSLSRVLLSNRAATFVGKISYPLYLWHWPLLAFLYILDIEKPEPPIRVVLVAIAFALATLTWALVEMPIRRRHNNGRTAMLLLAGMGLISAASWTIGYGLDLNGRAVNQINGGDMIKASGIDNPPLPVHDCSVPDLISKLFRNCIQERSGPANFVLLGDSKADALYRGLMRSSLPSGRWLYLGGADATTFGAPTPLLSTNPAWSRLQPQSQAAIDYIIKNKGIHVVLYAVALRNIYRLDDNGGAGRLFNSYDHRYLANLKNTKLSVPAQTAVIDGVRRLVAAGKIVAILVDNPPMPPLRNCNGRLTALAPLNSILGLKKGSADPDCLYPSIKYRSDAKIYLDMLNTVKSRFGDKVIIFDYTSLYCQEKGRACGTSVEGNALYGYTDHISSRTAEIMGRSINNRLSAF